MVPSPSRHLQLLMLLLLLVSTSRAWAWGCTGHETVALIAQLELNKLDTANNTHVLDQVKSLLALQSRPYTGRFCSDLKLDPIAYYATWADDHRTVDATTGPWHFWDIPLSVKTGKDGKYCSDGCVIQALKDQIAILKDKTKPDADRSIALLYVIHFIGDMHQPLHAEDNNDRGGNCVPVDYLGTAAKSTDAKGDYSLNLHGVWDTQLLEAAGKITRKDSEAATEIEAFANSLFKTHAATINRAGSAPVNLVAWANAAHAIARRHPYTLLTPPIAPTAKVQPVTLCSDNNTSATYFALNETIAAPYAKTAATDIRAQISLAGGRLAAVLYSSLGTASGGQ